MRRLAWLACASLLTAALVTPPAQADEGVVVTWPALSAFNPDHVDYVIQVEDSVGTGHLVARWGSYGSTVELPHSGSATMAFDHDGYDVVRVYRCTALPFTGCGTALAVSPAIEVRKKLSIPLALNRDPLTVATYGPSQAMTATATLLPWEEPTTASWRIVQSDAPDTALVSGQVAFDGATKSFSPSLSGLSSGPHTLVVEAEQDTADFGHLTGSVGVDFVVDSEFSLQASAIGEALVYPAEDYYKNFTGVRLTADESIDRAWLTVLRPDGMAVGARRAVELKYVSGQYRVTFDGKVGGKPLAEGDYRLRVDAEDLYGNAATALTGTVRVEDDQFRTVTIEKKLKPAKVLVDSEVQACSTLARPATRRWPGSLGFLSQTKCRRPGASAVVTVSGFALPTLTGLHSSGFRRVSLTLEGGPSKGPNARTVYINSGMYSANGKRVENVSSLPGRYGRHLVMADYAKPYVNTRGPRPMLYWFTGLTAGSRYDVRRYLLKVTYVDLVDPDEVK